MSVLSTIHVGEAGEDLRRSLRVLESVNVNTDDFMRDLVSTLRYELDFPNELNIFLEELIYGEYYHYKLSHGNIDQFKDFTNNFMDETARLSMRVVKQIHYLLVTKGMYNQDGKFPYEFHQFNGRVISLRST